MSQKVIELDVSELEAPKPLIEAVVAMDALGKDEVLLFRHRMNPRHLFNEIAAKGFSYEIIKDEPNEFVMKIYRKKEETKNVSGT